jgi:hypothetical protein
MSKAIYKIAFIFMVGSLVAWGVITTQSLNAAVALADAVPTPDARQVAITAPTPIKLCPRSQYIVNNAGVPMPTKPYPTEPYPTLAPTEYVRAPTESYPTETPTQTPAETSCVPPVTEPATTVPYPSITEKPTVTEEARRTQLQRRGY